MNRRHFAKGLLGLTGAGILTGLYTWQVEPFWLEFVRVKMPIRNLPKDLEGKTLMQISDVHVGRRFDYHFIIDSLKKAKEYNPDFVVYTGDYISHHGTEVLYKEFEEVLGHAVHGKLGTAGVLGNHDYGRNWSERKVANKVSSMLGDHGIYVLRNDQKVFAGLNVIGFDDYWAVNFKPQEVMANYDRSKPSVLLCHNPDVCDLDVWNNYQGWILSGHTHGGQCKPPFLTAPMLPVKNKRYSHGIVQLNDERQVYINRALGHLWQVRFNVRPEITIFELAQG